MGLMKSNIKFAAGCLTVLVVSLLLWDRLRTPVFWLCECFLLLLLGIYFALGVCHPFMEQKELMQYAVRNREWDGLFQNVIWKKMDFHVEIEKMMRGMAAEEKNKEEAANYEKQAIVLSP